MFAVMSTTTRIARVPSEDTSRAGTVVVGWHRGATKPVEWLALVSSYRNESEDDDARLSKTMLTFIHSFIILDKLPLPTVQDDDAKTTTTTSPLGVTGNTTN